MGRYCAIINIYINCFINNFMTEHAICVLMLKMIVYTQENISTSKDRTLIYNTAIKQNVIEENYLRNMVLIALID